MKRFVKKIYHEMQRHYLTFRILVCLKECGITRKINFLISHSDDKERRLQPTAAMLQSKRFFEENKQRLHRIKFMLADEKSWEVLKAVIRYRTMCTPYPRDLYSEEDQYFVKDIISIEDGEVFVDGGAYTGDTIQQFMDTARNGKKKYKKIIAFEPDEKNYRLLNKFFGGGGEIKFQEYRLV